MTFSRSSLRRCGLRSVRQNSDNREKYREKRQHLHKLATKIAKAQRPWGFLVKNAPNNNREKIFNNREALQNNREKYSFRVSVHFSHTCLF